MECAALGVERGLWGAAWTLKVGLSLVTDAMKGSFSSPSSSVSMLASGRYQLHSWAAGPNFGGKGASPGERS